MTPSEVFEGVAHVKHHSLFAVPIVFRRVEVIERILLKHNVSVVLVVLKNMIRFVRNIFVLLIN
jgi:hypothetical protein